MITAIEIENFKAFGNRQRIELAPITLIYGENGAGKTSILQAINLLKQTHESRDSGAVLLPRAEDGIVDLGSFTELLFDHDTERTLRIGVELQPERTGRWSRQLRFHEMLERESVGIELAFKRAKKSGEVGLSELNLRLGGGIGELARFAAKQISEKKRRSMQRYFWGPVPSQKSMRHRWNAAECEWLTDKKEFWEPFYKAWHARRSDVAKIFKQGDTLKMLRRVVLEDDQPPEESYWRDNIEQAVAFYRRDFSITEFIERMRKWSVGAAVGLDGFIPSGPVANARIDIPESLLSEPSPFSHGELHGLPLADFTRLSIMAGRLLEESLTALFPMGPFRRPPERWYIFTGTSPIDVGYKGDHLPDLLFRRPELVTKANGWLTRLEIGYQLRVKQVGEYESDLFEVRLVDNRRDKEIEVGLADVGFGISQILPFIVQALASEDQLISIEQPEVHIHPRLQADLGELIAEATKPPYGHRFLIETHSEHLVLRIQRLIREKRLAPKDVSVNYVMRGKEGSTVTRLRLDDAGDFIDEWPNGFFPERLRELR